jgi:hypothetical protein
LVSLVSRARSSKAVHVAPLLAFSKPTTFASPDGKVVVARVDVEAVAKPTGRVIREEDEIHLWRFGANGLVARFRHGVDTHKHVAALRGG